MGEGPHVEGVKGDEVNPLISTVEKGGFIIKAYGDGIIAIKNLNAKDGNDPATLVLFPAGDVIAYTSDMKPIIPAPREIHANGVFVNLLPEERKGIFVSDTNDGSSFSMLGNGKGKVLAGIGTHIENPVHTHESNPLISTTEKGGFIVEAYGDGVIRIQNPHTKNANDPATLVLFPAGDVIAYTSDMKPIIPAPREVHADGVFVNLLPEKEKGIFVSDTNDGSSFSMLGDGKGVVIEEHPKHFGQLLEAGNFKQPILSRADSSAQHTMPQRPARSDGRVF